LSRPESPRTVPLPPDVADALAAAAPRLGLFSRQILWFTDVPSTNDVALQLAERGAHEGCVVAAECQTAGRGRQGRSWWSPAGAGLYVSLILRPGAAVAPVLTLGTGVALAEGIAAATGLTPTLKWPNDLYVNERKLGGILAEAGTSRNIQSPNHVVLGFGINIRPAAYPADLSARATSLESELGRPVDRGTVLCECLAALMERYTRLQAGGVAPILEEWRVLAKPMLHRLIEWDGPSGTRRGIAEDVDASGALLVRTSIGRERLIAGEVRWM